MRGKQPLPEDLKIPSAEELLRLAASLQCVQDTCDDTECNAGRVLCVQRAYSLRSPQNVEIVHSAHSTRCVREAYVDDDDASEDDGDDASGDDDDDASGCGGRGDDDNDDDAAASNAYLQFLCMQLASMTSAGQLGVFGDEYGGAPIFPFDPSQFALPTALAATCAYEEDDSGTEDGEVRAATIPVSDVDPTTSIASSIEAVAVADTASVSASASVDTVGESASASVDTVGESANASESASVQNASIESASADTVSADTTVSL